MDRMPWGAALVLAGVLVGAGALLVWIGRRSAAGTLRRNPVAGIRTPATMASDPAWEAAHRATATWLLAAGVVSAATGVAMLLRPPNAIAMTIVLGGAALLTALGAIGGVKGHRAAKAVGPEAPA